MAAALLFANPMMSKERDMSSSAPLQRHPDAVADKVLKRAELVKMARRLKEQLALAKFKTKHGVEDLPLDMLEPRFEEERRRRKRLSAAEGDMMSDSSSSAGDLPYPSSRTTLMSSPLKAGPIFSDAVGSSNGSTGHRKRTYMASFDAAPVSLSPTKRFRSSPTPHKSAFGPNNGNSSSAWREHHQLAQSSPIKPRRQQHFTTSTGPDVSLFRGSQRITDALASSPNYAALSDDDEDLLPAHSFIHPDTTASGAATISGPAYLRSSPPPAPRTPPMRNRSLNRMGKAGGGDANNGGTGDEADKTTVAGGEEGADLLLYLAASPSPANPSGVTTKTSRLMEPPSTPPSKNNLALPSSMMTTPGGGGIFGGTPGQNFEFSDFINMSPSPAPKKGFKTPVAPGGVGRTPLSVARRRLTFGE